MTVNLSNAHTGPGPVDPSKKHAHTHLSAEQGDEESFSKHLHHKRHKHHHQHHHLFPQNAHDEHGNYF